MIYTSKFNDFIIYFFVILSGIIGILVGELWSAVFWPGWIATSLSLGGAFVLLCALSAISSSLARWVREKKM